MKQQHSTAIAPSLALLLVAIALSAPALAEGYILITPVDATAGVNDADAPKTIDENPNEFSLPTFWQAAGDPEACIAFDLGETMKVVGFRETSGPFPSNPFTAFASTDGMDFTQVASGSLTQLAFGTHFFSGVNVRFMALCLQRTNATGYGELADFRALVSIATEIEIDVKPGSDRNSVNPRSRGVIPVAILTTEDFDATAVDVLSVRFGPDDAMERHGRGHLQDADGDGDRDLMLHFSTQDTGIVCGDISVFLTGETVGGQAITGSDFVRTVGCD